MYTKIVLNQTISSFKCCEFAIMAFQFAFTAKNISCWNNIIINSLYGVTIMLPVIVKITISAPTTRLCVSDWRFQWWSVWYSVKLLLMIVTNKYKRLKISYHAIRSLHYLHGVMRGCQINTHILLKLNRFSKLGPNLIDSRQKEQLTLMWRAF